MKIKDLSANADKNNNVIQSFRQEIGKLQEDNKNLF